MEYKFIAVSNSSLVKILENDVLIGTLNSMPIISVLPSSPTSFVEINGVGKEGRRIRCLHTEIVTPTHTTIDELISGLAILFPASSGTDTTNHSQLTNRDDAGNHAKLIPILDSAIAIQITKADGTTVILNIDSTNERVGIGTIEPKSALQVIGGIQCSNDIDIASVDKVGTFRYRTSGNNSYVDICMQNGTSSYIWENIITQTW